MDIQCHLSLSLLRRSFLRRWTWMSSPFSLYPLNHFNHFVLIAPLLHLSPGFDSCDPIFFILFSPFAFSLLYMGSQVFTSRFDITPLRLHTPHRHPHLLPLPLRLFPMLCLLYINSLIDAHCMGSWTRDPMQDDALAPL